MFRSYIKLAVVILAAAVLGGVPAVAQQPPIRIGIDFSYSGGDNVVLGKMFDAAVAAYMKQHGDTIAGRKIELIKRDDGGIAPDVAKRLVQEMIVNDKVDIILGTTYTPNAIAVAQVSTQAKKPFFIVNAATSGIIAKNPYSVRFAFTTAQITAPFAKWVAQTGSKTAYALFQDYGPGIDAGTTFEKTFEAAGGKMLGEARIPVDNRDFSAYIQRVKDAKPEVVFVFINATGGGAQFIKAYKDAGLDKAGIKLLATGDLVDEAILPAEGESALGLITVFDYSAAHNSAINRDFVKAFQAQYSDHTQLPTFIAAQGYDAIAAIYKVIEAQKGQVDPDKTMELVKGMKFEGPRGPIMIDPETRDIVQNAYIRRVERKNGTLVNTEFVTIPMVKDPNE